MSTSNSTPGTSTGSVFVPKAKRHQGDGGQFPRQYAAPARRSTAESRPAEEHHSDQGGESSGEERHHQHQQATASRRPGATRQPLSADEARRLRALLNDIVTDRYGPQRLRPAGVQPLRDLHLPFLRPAEVPPPRESRPLPVRPAELPPPRDRLLPR